MKKAAAYERLNAERIGRGIGIPVTVLSTVDSTNTEIRRRLLSGEACPQILLAEEQTAGRGRMGRSFYSPEGTGLYLSICFPLPSEGWDALPLTAAAAVSVHRAIARVTGIVTGIKWVNDLYYRDRKVSGILAESLLLDEKRYGILGVGINLYTEEFPPELQHVAGGLSEADAGLRNRLAAELCAELERLIGGFDPEEVLRAYRAHSAVLGQPITYTENQVSHEGVATEIDEKGRLTVRHADGSLHVLAGGEISLRLRK